MHLVLAIYSLILVRYICFANSIYSHFVRLRYDINSFFRCRRQHIALKIYRVRSTYNKFRQEFISLKKAYWNFQYAFFWRRHPDLNRGMKVLQTLALPLGYSAEYGAGNEIRTRDVHLGKVTLYHWAIPANIWWEQQGSNLWPSACKADALPAELSSRTNFLALLIYYNKL